LFKKIKASFRDFSSVVSQVREQAKDAYWDRILRQWEEKEKDKSSVGGE